MSQLNKKAMGKRNGPEDLLYSLSVLRPGEAKRCFRKAIFNEYPLRGPLGQPACAYCGKWHEKLTIDHVIAKSKGGPHFAKWNSAPACLACNADKSNLPVFEWWRPKQIWTPEREEYLVTWIYINSYISACTDQWEYENLMQKDWMHIDCDRLDNFKNLINNNIYSSESVMA